MQNQNEIAKINYFLCVVSPIIVGHMKMLCQSTGAKVREQGRGLDLSLLIKSGKKKMKFFLHNLFLEIATVNRDDDPLRFDERLRDFDFLSGQDDPAHSKQVEDSLSSSSRGGCRCCHREHRPGCKAVRAGSHLEV